MKGRPSNTTEKEQNSCTTDLMALRGIVKYSMQIMRSTMSPLAWLPGRQWKKGVSVHRRELLDIVSYRISKSGPHELAFKPLHSRVFPKNES